METKVDKKNIFQKFDGLIKTFIPNFNVRAILYFTLILAISVFIEVWQIAGKSTIQPTKETVVADDAYWQSQSYKNKISSQTVETFTKELRDWLENNNSEFTKRKFEDIFYINSSLTLNTGGDLSIVIPQNFNYLENTARAKYQYARSKGFANDQPALVPLGKLTCDEAEKVQKNTEIEVFDWRYASMPKLASFLATKPDWKMYVGDHSFDVSDPNIEDADILKLKNANTQPVGLFSFLIFHDPKTNKVFLADNEILESNAVDSKLTLSRVTLHLDKQPKMYFKYGYEGCKQINNFSNIDYGRAD